MIEVPTTLPRSPRKKVVFDFKPHHRAAEMAILFINYLSFPRVSDGKAI